MSDTTLRYYDATMSFIPNRSVRRVQHARKMLRLTTSRRRIRQSIRSMISKVF